MILKYALVGLVLLGGLNTYAQEEKSMSVQSDVKNTTTPADKVDKKVEKLTEKLSLTEEQATNIKALLVDMVGKVQEIKADEAISKEDKKTKVKALKESFRTDLEANLDESQKAKFAELEAEHEAKKAEKKANKKTTGEKAAALTAKMTEILSLTPEQVEKVRVLNLKVTTKIEVIINDDSMTNEKKKEFILGNKADHKNVMNSILTEAQMVTYEAWIAKKKDSLREEAPVTE